MGDLGDGTGSAYPGALDTDATLEVDSPAAGKTKARADVPNDLAAAIIAIQTELGTDPAGSLTDVKTRLAVALKDDGTLQETLSPTFLGLTVNSSSISFSQDTTVNLSSLIGFGNDVALSGALITIDQSSTTSGLACLKLDQADIDQDFLKIIGRSDTFVDRALVDAVDFSTPGAIVGWLKINVTDIIASDGIVDGDYYIPFYAAPTV